MARTVVPDRSGRWGVDLAIAAALGVSALALYVLTLCPSVFWYDSAEYVTAAVTLGIPHPPGYPLYTLIGHVFTWLPGDPAHAVNLMSACFAGITVALAYGVARRLAAARIAAIIAAAALATSSVFWAQATIAEVYAPGLAFLLGVVLLVLRGLERDRGVYLVGAALLAGLGLGVHMSIATCGLGLAFLVLTLGLRIERPGDLRTLLSRDGLARRLTVAGLCCLALALGACVFLWLPIRASMQPALNFENPATLDKLAWFVTGGNFKSWFVQDYDRFDRLARVAGIFYDQFLVVGALLCATGFAALVRRQAKLALAVVLMAGGNVAFFFSYSVHDLEVFFLPAITVGFLLVAPGVQAVVDVLETRIPAENRRTVGLLVRGALVILPLAALAGNYTSHDMSDYDEAEVYGETLAETLPPGATILNFTTPPEWAHDAVFTHYFQKVRGVRGDVGVVTVTTQDMPWIASGVAEGRAVFVFAPVGQVATVFELEEQQGPIWRLVRPLPAEAQGPGHVQWTGSRHQEAPMLEIAERAAREAGRIMREGRARAVQHKGAVNLVTEVDLACETAVREILTQGDPGIPVMGEEEGGAEDAATRWIVDPLDGTTNYVHGYPSYCCCIALQDRGELEIGVIYDPVRDQCYRGQRGRGADLAGAPLRVSTCDDLDRGLMASGFPYDRRERIDEYLAYVRAFILKAQGFRRAGAAGMDLAWLAAGRVDGFWEFGLQPWDVAAGTLLVREAGGEVTDMDGGPLDVEKPRILASNGLLHQAMLDVIAELL